METSKQNINLNGDIFQILVKFLCLFVIPDVVGLEKCRKKQIERNSAAHKPNWRWATN